MRLNDRFLCKRLFWLRNSIWHECAAHCGHWKDASHPSLRSSAKPLALERNFPKQNQVNHLCQISNIMPFANHLKVIVHKNLFWADLIFSSTGSATVPRHYHSLLWFGRRHDVCVTLQAQSLFSTQSSSEQIKMESWVTSSGPGFGDITFFYNAERQNVCWREKESHNDNELWITNIDTERELASHRSAHLSIHPSRPLVLTKLPLFPTSVFSCQSIKPTKLNI